MSPSPPSSASWRHDDLVAGGLRFHVVRAGRGRPVLLLHGFPEFWFSWRYQIAALAEAGYEAVAPDLRGYNTSEKPHGVEAYQVEALADDVAALADEVCGGRALLAGHDWGGIVAWYAAMRHLRSVEKLVVVNAPHPAAFARDFWRTDQFLRSFYMFLFQVPRLPEALIRAGDFRVIGRMFEREVHNREAFAGDEVRRYKEALAQPGALTSAIHYYRAAFRRSRRIGARDVTPITMPTLLLWGERDPHLRVSLASGLDEWVTDLTVQRLPRAGHWAQLDEPDAVSRAMIEFFDAPSR